MPGCYIYVWLFLFTAFVTVQTGLFNRVELTGEKLDNQTDSLKEVEWTNVNKSCLCLKYFKQNNLTLVYSKCCGKAHFYLNNNSLILENLSAQAEVVFKETIISNNLTAKSLTFVIHILYPKEVVVCWSSNLSLTCKVSGPFTGIMWKRGDSPILSDNRHSFSESNRTLHISNITCSDYGKYICVATDSYGKSETHTYINEECFTDGENTTCNQEPPGAKSNQLQDIKIFLLTGLVFIGILGLCVIVFYGINKYSHSQVHRGTQDRKTRGHRREDDRTTEEDVDINLVIYQEISGTEVSLLPYVYTDFIKPREAHQNSAEAEDTKDLGYSEIGPAVSEQIILDHSSSDEQPTPCPNTAEE